MSQPRVSVIILSYNQAEYLAAAINSVLEQSYTAWELIVVENGSTDESKKVLERYRDDQRVHLLVHNQNDAPNKRLNAALATARGEFISVLYSDDFYLPHKLERQVHLFDADDSETGVVHGPGYRLNVATEERWQEPSFDRSGWVFEAMLEQIGRGPLVNPIAPLIRRECLIVHPFNEDVFMEGESIFLRIAMTHKFLYAAEPTVVMREHANNLGRSVKRNYIQFLRMLDLLEQAPGFPPDELQRLSRARIRTYRAAGWQGIRVLNDPVWAQQMLRQAVAGDWRQAVHPRVGLGFLASLLPSRARSTLQAALKRLRRHKGYDTTVSRET